MASTILVCSEPYAVLPGNVTSCPGTLSTVDLSIIVSASESGFSPVIAAEHFGAGLVVAAIPLLIVMVCRIVIYPLFQRFLP